MISIRKRIEDLLAEIWDGDLIKAHQWMAAPCKVLDNCTPNYVLAKKPRVVLQLLEDIKWGQWS